MKKINIIIALAAAFSFSMSVFAQSKAPVLKNRTDSLNYAFGIYQGDGIKMYYLYNDSTGERLKSLMKGIEDGMKKSVKYAELAGIGTNIGQSLKAQKEIGLFNNEDITVDFELIKQGLINGILAYDQMSPSEAEMYINTTMQELEEKKNEQLYGENRRQGEAFLAENASKPGVITTESGLQYKVIRSGRGTKPTSSDLVKVTYKGTLIDGTEFDSSTEPITFGVTQVIRGWTEALLLMPVGSTWELYIPQELAYGSQNMGTIQPYSALVFEVRLVGIEK